MKLEVKTGEDPRMDINLLSSKKRTIPLGGQISEGCLMRGAIPLDQIPARKTSALTKELP